MSADSAATDAERAAEAADREFAVVLARLGIDMPPDLAPGVLAGYRSLRAQMRLLRDSEGGSADV
ncbi:hypothetical protein B4N89_05160 [Embleya scabrispora]|uniref:Uncharacterized protein n=1 Tax=Embleya scabrispora TaxID=159449 RepID=A0A1T3NUK5_9ACTN|nr:hypothetical protein [Embleya scabrispora]OPC80415.1 hypothetical protein B4N89_05160 [Embleya scabrispora]